MVYLKVRKKSKFWDVVCACTQQGRSAVTCQHGPTLCDVITTSRSRRLYKRGGCTLKRAQERAVLRSAQLYDRKVHICHVARKEEIELIR